MWSRAGLTLPSGGCMGYPAYTGFWSFGVPKTRFLLPGPARHKFFADSIGHLRARPGTSPPPLEAHVPWPPARTATAMWTTR